MSSDYEPTVAETQLRFQLANYRECLYMSFDYFICNALKYIFHIYERIYVSNLSRAAQYTHGIGSIHACIFFCRLFQLYNVVLHQQCVKKKFCYFFVFQFFSCHQHVIIRHRSTKTQREKLALLKRCLRLKLWITNDGPLCVWCEHLDIKIKPLPRIEFDESLMYFCCCLLLSLLLHIHVICMRYVVYSCECVSLRCVYTLLLRPVI
jgi:hypothetical protein